MIAKSHYANGKLLLTGEYLVMEGAKALALPLKLGQYLSCKKTKEKNLIWNAMKPDGTWFQAKYSLPDLELLNATDEKLSNNLIDILLKCRSLQKEFLNGEEGFEVQTILEFDPDFGFGSSSTLVSNLAAWADIDPYELLKITFGGSGYDIACAKAKKPLFYSIKSEKPLIEDCEFDPVFKENILFVYLGRKQVSKDSISSFQRDSKFSGNDIKRISQLSLDIERAMVLNYFENLVNEHEDIMSSILKLPKVKDIHFNDHNGAVKSLGAWGGDFVLMTFHDPPETVTGYLKEKGYNIFYNFADLVRS